MKKFMKIGVNPALYKQMIKVNAKRAETLALLSATKTAQETADESGNYSKAIIGTSIALLGPAAAIFAARRCTKKDNDFERQ